ncbi:MAG: hypothetical protein NVSMB25_02410 [Thermoleophilaceae bacterium]
MRARLRRAYGAGPLHALLLIASFAVAAAAFAHFFDRGPDTLRVLVWLLGAVLLHDIFLLPLYSAMDLIAGRVLSSSPRALSARNHLRVPAALSGLLLLVYFPLILQLGTVTYRAATGTNPTGYLARWLAITAVLFLGSALAYALRERRRSRPPRMRAPGGAPGP